MLSFSKSWNLHANLSIILRGNKLLSKTTSKLQILEGSSFLSWDVLIVSEVHMASKNIFMSLMMLRKVWFSHFKRKYLSLRRAKIIKTQSQNSTD